MASHIAFVRSMASVLVRLTDDKDNQQLGNCHKLTIARISTALVVPLTPCSPALIINGLLNRGRSRVIILLGMRKDQLIFHYVMLI